jgi:hypothetical protein
LVPFNLCNITNKLIINYCEVSKLDKA